MRLYKVTTKAPLASTGKQEVRWVGTAALARAEKKAMCSRHGLKATGADYSEEEVPTAKPLFLEWLNARLRQE